MGPRRPFGRQLQHAGPQGGEQATTRRHGGGCVPVPEAVEAVEVRHHPRPGPGVVLGQHGVAGAQAEDEAPGVPGVERRHRRRQLRRGCRPDAHDPARHRHRARGVQQPPESAGQAALETPRAPQRAVAEGLHVRGDVERRLVVGAPAATPPDPHATQVHGFQCRSPPSDGPGAVASRYGLPVRDGVPQNRGAWELEAENWLRWARTPGHDAYWFYRDAFFETLVPPPGRLTVEVGCGEGRVTRDLRGRRHRVVSVDGAPTLLRVRGGVGPRGPLHPVRRGVTAAR